MRQQLLQNATILLQYATVITINATFIAKPSSTRKGARLLLKSP